MYQTKTLLLALALIAGVAAAAQTANRFDIVITEIMADPTPVVGLPNAEYIEIKNLSAVAIPLNGWQLSDATSTATLKTAFVLQPDSLVILCANSNVATLSAFGRTLGVTSFPSLDNDGELLVLRSPENRVIHAVLYSADWYANEAKKDGGWSLEMIDPHNPCSGKDNWKASISSVGGTPGTTNSVNGTTTDNTPPQPLKAYAIDSTTIRIVFSEPLDSNSAATASSYVMDGFGILSARPVAPLFQMVELMLTKPMQPGSIYTLSVSRLTDCSGNAMAADKQLKTGLPQPPAPGDVVINEILFNPRPGGSDYVEFFNRSNKIIDAATLYTANRNSSGAVGSLKRLTEEPLLFFPGDYLVATEDRINLQLQYLVKNEDAVLQLASLPSYPDDKGTVVLQSLGGDVLDEVSYEKSWHFALIDNDEGVSLERIDPTGLSQKKSNWHSAAATAGYGTPGYQNSQYKQTEQTSAAITVSPRVFSPDNDGRDDIATITYQVEEKGYVANVFIFDAAGRLVRQLVKNDLLAQKGYWRWDGLGEHNNKLPVGTYIVFTEIFNLDGKKQSFKQTIVLARQLN